jgi:hypothetical protein
MYYSSPATLSGGWPAPPEQPAPHAGARPSVLVRSARRAQQPRVQLAAGPQHYPGSLPVAFAREAPAQFLSRACQRLPPETPAFRGA